MNELPNGWERASLGDICGQPTQRVPNIEEEFTYIDIASVDRDRKVVAKPQILAGANAPSRARKVLETGDVIVSMTRPNLNAVALIGANHNGSIASTGFDVLKARGVDPRWVFAAVRSAQFVEAMCEKVQGALYPAIKSTEIREYEIPLPPAGEQPRIATKLDELLAQVDILKARTDGIPTLLKRFRESVLAAAVSGRLTEEWRTGEEYFIESVMLADLVKNSLVGLVRSAAEQSEDEDQGTPYLKMNNISNNWGVALESLAYVSVTEAETKRYSLTTGDWLFNTRNSQELVGKSCIWRDTEKVFVFNNNILRIRFSDRAIPEFIDIWYRSPLGCEALEKIKSATTSVAAIYQKALMSQIIPLPKTDEQIEIVRRVEQLFAFAERLETGVKAAQARIDRLTQSILAKAFRGELVPQDPKDEPARALLERIKAQRAAAPKAKRTRQAANPS